MSDEPNMTDAQRLRDLVRVMDERPPERSPAERAAIARMRASLLRGAEALEDEDRAVFRD